MAERGSICQHGPLAYIAIVAGDRLQPIAPECVSTSWYPPKTGYKIGRPGMRAHPMPYARTQAGPSWSPV